jgi:hypothetical protein
MDPRGTSPARTKWGRFLLTSCRTSLRANVDQVPLPLVNDSMEETLEAKGVRTTASVSTRTDRRSASGRQLARPRGHDGRRTRRDGLNLDNGDTWASQGSLAAQRKQATGTVIGIHTRGTSGHSRILRARVA